MLVHLEVEGLCIWSGDILYSATCEEGKDKEAIYVCDVIYEKCPYCGKKIKYIGEK